MSKQAIRKPAAYIISKWTIDAHHRIYLTGYNINNRTANWSSNSEDANTFMNPIEARMITNCVGIKDADILCRPIEIEEEIKEMKANIIIQSHWYSSRTCTTVYVKTVERDTRKVIYTKNKVEARRFTCVSAAENFIKCYSPLNPVIMHYHDDAPDALRYCTSDVIATAEYMRELYHVKKEKDTMLPEIKNIIFNDPATIVFWADGTKTVVKCQKDEIYDPEKGLAMAITKKALGNKYNYYNTIKHWLKKAPKMKTSRFYGNGIGYTHIKGSR